MKKSKKKGEVKGSNKWWCMTCRGTAMNHGEIKLHLELKHGLDLKKTPATREMLAHMDADTWFGSTYNWTFTEGEKAVILRQDVISPRAKDDPMRCH